MVEIKYADIAEVNKLIKYTDVRGKNYAEVAQRVQAFRKLIPCGYITTEIVGLENGVVYMKAECGYYEHGSRVMLATGYAFERQDASNINKTSFIENCETSAIGRALGFIGLGSEKSIASAEEVSHAIETQEAIEAGKLPDPVKNVTVTTAAKVPEAKQEEQKETVSPVLEYLAKEREGLRIVREISKAENNLIWKEQIKAMTEAGIIPRKPLAEFTMDEAKTAIDTMYKRFSPKGTVLNDDGKIA